MQEILSHSNETVKMLKSLKQRKYRDELGKYIVEGAKTIEEAVGSGQPVEMVVTSDRKNATAAAAEARGIRTIAVPYSVIQQIADTKSPPREIACIAKLPERPIAGGRFFVAMDDINDPKNLGSIIRTADALGADGVFISESSADFYGPKAQRAAMGSTFHLPVEVCDLPRRLEQFKREGGVIVAGSLEGTDELLGGYEKVCVVIGNEARGISAEVGELADERYRIPLKGRAESLNAGVAAGILLYEVGKRLNGQALPKGYKHGT